MTPDRGGGVHRKDFTPQKTTAAFRNASCRPVDLFLSGKLREAENGVTATGKEAAALEAELGAEVRAGEDVASLGTPLPSSEGLPASGSTSSSPTRRLGPLPAVGRVEAVGEHASEEQGTGMGSGGAAEATDGASMVAVAEDGRTNGSRRSPPGPAAASTCPALVAAACAPHPDPAFAFFAAPLPEGDAGEAE